MDRQENHLKTEIEDYKYVTVNQFCDVLEDFIQRNKDKERYLDEFYDIYVKYDNNCIYSDKYQQNKVIIKPILISLYKHEQLKRIDILKLFKCKKLYLKAPKQRDHYYDDNRYTERPSYIIIDGGESIYKKGDKEYKYHHIILDYSLNDTFEIEATNHMDESYPEFIKKVVL